MAQMYTTNVPASPVDGGNVNRTKNGGGGILGPTLRAVLVMASVAFLLMYLARLGAQREANLKQLSDEVMRLQRELNQVDLENERNSKEKETLAKEVQDEKIELAWQTQHVHDQAEATGIMYEAMSMQIQRDHDMLAETTELTEKYARSQESNSELLGVKRMENVELKEALGQAMNDLAQARGGHPPAPDQDQDLDDKVGERNLRVQRSYQPGDGIDIIEYEEGGKIALRPGIVSDVKPNGTYDLVKLGHSIVLEGMDRKSFQTYRVYREGEAAHLEVANGMYAQITIVKFLRGSARKGFETGGRYEVTFDGDTRQPMKVQEAKAMNLHRYVAVGEVLVAESGYTGMRP